MNHFFRKTIIRILTAGLFLYTVFSFPISAEAESGETRPAYVLEPPIIVSVSCPSDGQLALTASCGGHLSGYVLTYRLGTSRDWVRQVIPSDSDTLTVVLKDLPKQNHYLGLCSYLIANGCTYYSLWCPTEAHTPVIESKVPSVRVPSKFTVCCKKNGQLKISASGKGDISGFTIAYKRTGQSKWKKKNISVDGTKLRYTLKNLKKKSYHVCVRAYQTYHSVKYYSDWCNTITIKAKK